MHSDVSLIKVIGKKGMLILWHTLSILAYISDLNMYTYIFFFTNKDKLVADRR